jgi:hypothetical protein
MIREIHPGSGSRFFLPIPDPGVKKAPDLGSATMSLNIILYRYRVNMAASFP